MDEIQLKDKSQKCSKMLKKLNTFDTDLYPATQIKKLQLFCEMQNKTIFFKSVKNRK